MNKAREKREREMQEKERDINQFFGQNDFMRKLKKNAEKIVYMNKLRDMKRERARESTLM